MRRKWTSAEIYRKRFFDEVKALDGDPAFARRLRVAIAEQVDSLRGEFFVNGYNWVGSSGVYEAKKLLLLDMKQALLRHLYAAFPSIRRACKRAGRCVGSFNSAPRISSALARAFVAGVRQACTGY